MRTNFVIYPKKIIIFTQFNYYMSQLFNATQIPLTI